MPPKSKINKELVLQAVYAITQRCGFEGVNARSVAKELNISTRPIFTWYKSMDEIKRDFWQYLQTNYSSHIQKEYIDQNNNNIGLAYILFAKNEPHLFRFLTMSDNLHFENLNDFFIKKDTITLANQFAHDNNISIERAKEIIFDLWIYAHGLSSLIVTGNIDISVEQITQLFDKATKDLMSMKPNQSIS